VSVPYNGGTPRDYVFVLDPQLGKHGSWTAYDLEVGPFLEWSPPGAATTFLAAHVGGTQVLSLDNTDVAYDDFGAGAVHIDSYYRTRWVDLGQPALPKRWKRPQIVVKGGEPAVIGVEAFSDYDPTRIRRNFTITTTADATGMVWGTGQWGTGLWASGGGDGRNQVERGSPLGNGKAIALKFRGPTTNHDWSVDAISFTYIPKKVR
jgi:hypothetical protein